MVTNASSRGSIPLALTFSQADNDGTTPIVAAAAFLHDSAVTFLQGLGASMPTDEMELKTVDDVVEFLRLSI